MPALEVTYCGVKGCGLPPEYCEFGKTKDECQAWLKENEADLYQKLFGIPEKDAPNWTVGDKLEVFSSSENKWCPGIVKRINGDKLTVQYKVDEDDDVFNDKDVTANDDSIRPVAAPVPVKEMWELSVEDEEKKEAAAAASKKKEKQKKKKGKKGKKGQGGQPKISIGQDTRKGNKKVTIVWGLVELGMKPKKASTAFRKKFACGVTAVKNASGKMEIIIQGDQMYDVANFIHNNWKVPPQLIYYRVGKGKNIKEQHACSPDGMVLPP